MSAKSAILHSFEIGVAAVGLVVLLIIFFQLSPRPVRPVEMPQMIGEKAKAEGRGKIHGG